MAYRVKFYEGTYRERQTKANADGAVLFVAHHLNSAHPQANYVLCNVASNASDRSKAIAAYYVRQVAAAFGLPHWGSDGVCVGGMGGRGDSQLRLARCPAILPEPLFVSNPESAAIVRTEHGRQALAECLADTIRHYVPVGWLIAFSVGHAGNPANPGDRGAVVFAKPNEAPMSEADAVEDILMRAKDLLEADS